MTNFGAFQTELVEILSKILKEFQKKTVGTCSFSWCKSIIKSKKNFSNFLIVFLQFH